MKYAKELDRILSGYSWFTRRMCVSYKKWKKKRYIGHYWRWELLTEFLLSPKSLVETNLKTLYKICKRLHKRFSIEGTREFYTWVSRSFVPFEDIIHADISIDHARTEDATHISDEVPVISERVLDPSS